MPNMLSVDLSFFQAKTAAALKAPANVQMFSIHMHSFFDVPTIFHG